MDFSSVVLFLYLFDQCEPALQSIATSFYLPPNALAGQSEWNLHMFKIYDVLEMAESLRNLPIYKKDSFTQFVPHSRSTESRITYVCTSSRNRSWVINGGRHMFYDLSLDSKREEYISSQTGKDDVECPPNKIPRLSAL
ncbi:unnamed protein product [Schistosoma intercalatum]|nr:unnamed protein product [Schistosoma intercalatum]